MRTPDRRSLHLFLAEAYEDLYRGAVSRLPQRFVRRTSSPSSVYLCEGPHRWWAVVAPIDHNTGRVEHSNVLPSGTVVKSRKSWRFASMRRDKALPQTIVSPRFLTILSLPPRPVSRRKRAAMRPLRDFSLVA